MPIEHNALNGPIPTELALFRSLVRLSFNFNELSGSIPSDIGKLSLLEVLSLRGNWLVGSIPRELFFSLPRLEHFLVSGNSLSGTLPTEIQHFNGRSIYLHENQITGQIPSEVSKMSSLIDLYIDDNHVRNLGWI